MTQRECDFTLLEMLRIMSQVIIHTQCYSTLEMYLVCYLTRIVEEAPSLEILQNRR